MVALRGVGDRREPDPAGWWRAAGGKRGGDGLHWTAPVSRSPAGAAGARRPEASVSGRNVVGGDELSLLRGGGALPSGAARLSRGTSAGRLERSELPARSGRARARRDRRRARARARCEALARARLAGALRRRRRLLPAADRLRRGDRLPRRPHPERRRRAVGRSRDHAFRGRGAARALPPAHRRWRGDLVHALLGARRGLRPRGDSHARRARRRRVGDQRAEAVGGRRGASHARLARGPHRPRRPRSTGGSRPSCSRWTPPASPCGP